MIVKETQNFYEGTQLICPCASQTPLTNTSEEIGMWIKKNCSNPAAWKLVESSEEEWIMRMEFFYEKGDCSCFAPAAQGAWGARIPQQQLAKK